MALVQRFRHPGGLFLAAPLGLGVAYVVLLLLHLGGIVEAIYRTPDYASAPVIAQLFSAAHGARVVLGDNPWYTSLWFELLTRRLPFHREIWEVSPWIGALVAIAIVAFATAKVAGPAAGALVVFVSGCAGPQPLMYEFGWTQHGPTVLPVCVLDGFLVLLVAREGCLGRRIVHGAACVVVAAVTAAAAASDELLFVAGLVPFAVSGLCVATVVGGRAGRRIGLTVVGIAAFAYAGSRVVIAAMEARNVYPTRFVISFASWGQLATNPRSTLQGLAVLVNGDFGAGAITGRSLLRLACAIVLSAALVVVGRAGWSLLAEVAARLDPNRQRHESRFDARQIAHVLFWVVAITTSLAALEFANITNAPSASRYLLSSTIGIVAIVAVATGRAGTLGRRAAVIGACIIVAASAVGLAAGDLEQNGGHLPTASFAQALAAYAAAADLTKGYALYYDAPALTWETNARLQVYPVDPCGAPSGLCIYPYHVITNWYAPLPRVRTFLLIDPRYGPALSALHLHGASRTVSLDGYTLLVFDYDIAADLGPPPPPLA